MKKKNLAILLIMPFLIALFGIATIKTAFNLIDNDVINISWDYAENELFVIGSETLLEAKTILADERYPASEGNELHWEVENADDIEEPHAEIDDRGLDGVYLIAKSEGDIRITCTTKKKNVMPLTMLGLIGDESKLLSINDKIGGSGQNIDSVKYYGEYDLVNGAKQQAVINFEIKTFSKTLRDGLRVEDYSSNLSVDLAGERITIKGAIDGMSYMTLTNPDADVSRTYSFKVVKDGINVFTYDDLLYCTNRSDHGEIAVLRKSFEAKSKVSPDASNVTAFGNNGSDFSNDVYKFDTTYNSEYVDRWNAFAKGNNNYSSIDKTIYAGLHVQKDLYGNGYTLNLHDLCFPTGGEDTASGSGLIMNGNKDLFRGPKPFYLLGDPNGLPLVTAYGQDNIGLYIDGNDITVNDVKVKNCDFGTIIQNLRYTGTVVEVNGRNNTIENSVLSNGKNVLRSFSSMNLTIDNCILQYAQNFLLWVGSNEYEKNQSSDTTKHRFIKLEDGAEMECTIEEYLQGEGDKLLGYFVSGIAAEDIQGMMNAVVGVAQLPTFPKERVQEALHLLQEALAHSDKITAQDIKGSTTINDSIFYYGGVASIGVETMFNGPFLYNDKPTLIKVIAGLLKGFGDEIFPMFPDNVSGASYPVSVDLSGNTRFYYDKTLDDWDISGLIGENMSKVVGSLGGDLDIDIDDIFPLKEILTKVARENGCICQREGRSYINIPVALYGGGVNLSVVNEKDLTSKGLTEIMDVDLLDSYLEMNMLQNPESLASLKDSIKTMLQDFKPETLFSNPDLIRYIKEVLTKTVTTVTGFEEFKFQFVSDPEGLFDENGKPKIADFTDLQKTFKDKEKK